MKTVTVTGSFDNLRSKHVRFLQEAAKCGNVHVRLWSDETLQALKGRPPRFPELERLYLLQSMRFVDQVTLVRGMTEPDVLPGLAAVQSQAWIVDEEGDTPGKRAYAEARGMAYRVLRNQDLSGLPVPSFLPPAFDSARKRVIVTGCFDWFHSGHVRFFEEASTLGDLYAVVGHDANIKLLKGEGHPLLSQAERLYMVHSVRYVHQAMISTGHGWLDAEPEIAFVNPHLYVVNEDGDKPEKRAFCAGHGIEYMVLKRIPKEGLPKRESTLLRGW
ncbi:MAG: adenylyltransferase/cytidyltransferase family protein [Terriglobia bacterium]|jgi:cytidyltransferase-like protein